ncbi:hypothetical protein L2D00_01465 [Hyphomonadaceae bacterium BL14]|nr:hypothetical protein L2D00_01465 [Hyphomonadaceae bacterium BL14]
MKQFFNPWLFTPGVFAGVIAAIFIDNPIASQALIAITATYYVAFFAYSVELFGLKGFKFPSRILFSAFAAYQILVFSNQIPHIEGWTAPSSLDALIWVWVLSLVGLTGLSAISLHDGLAREDVRISMPEVIFFCVFLFSGIFYFWFRLISRHQPARASRETVPAA